MSNNLHNGYCYALTNIQGTTFGPLGLRPLHYRVCRGGSYDPGHCLSSTTRIYKIVENKCDLGAHFAIRSQVN